MTEKELKTLVNIQAYTIDDLKESLQNETFRAKDLEYEKKVHISILKHIDEIVFDKKTTAEEKVKLVQQIYLK